VGVWGLRGGCVSGGPVRSVGPAEAVCLGCAHWQARGVPAWAADMGFVYCEAKRTRAVVLPWWRSCERWQAVPAAEVEKRVRWLGRRGVVVKLERAE